MTRKKWASLSQSQKIIKISELCGWRRQGDIETELFWWHPKLCAAGSLVICDNFPPDRGLPDYLYDLNAMHEAELSHALTRYRMDDYLNHLADVVDLGKTDNRRRAWPWVCATATQRAEAFVLTMEPE